MPEIQERRKSKRMVINVRIKLQKVKDNVNSAGLKKDEFEVNVINISKDGIAFKLNQC